MGMTTFVPHILYENNNQLYIGYSEEIDVRSLYNTVNGLTVQQHIASMYLKCRSFEDFPLAFTELMESIRNELIIPQHHKEHHRNLIFMSVAELTGEKKVINRIDLRKDFLKLWSTQFITFMNLTDYIVSITDNEGVARFLSPNEAIQLKEGCKSLTLLSRSGQIPPLVQSFT